MRQVIASIHCDDDECGPCEQHGNQGQYQNWCSLFRTVAHNGQRSHYCIEAENMLKDMRGPKPAPDKG